MSLKFCVPFALVAFCGFRPCLAQESLRRDSEVRLAPAQDSSVGALQPTPEMWFYEQERMRHDDPKMAIRERA